MIRRFLAALVQPLRPAPEWPRPPPSKLSIAFSGRATRRGLVACLPLALAACGGGGGDSGGTAPLPSANCSVADQKTWLADYMNEWYFWYRLSPRPDPAPYASALDYFDALLYTGTDSRFPADRWSGSETTESFNRFFGDGATLGYGVSVAGLEVGTDATRPLYVRYVEAASPAAAQDVRRGDRIVSVNGRSAASVIAAEDYAALTATQAGESLTLQLERGGATRTVTLTAAVFALTPVGGTQVLRSNAGRRLGYMAIKDMVSQALAPMDAAFAQFKAAGVQDVVLDLRYNGGGLVSTGGTLASLIAGSRGVGLNYATLLYNDKRAATNNSNFAFTAPASSLGLPRVLVLTGRRTCSASEQVINGLRGAGVDVVAIGETTCGKPVGFLPASHCGRTYSIVNFESVNHRNEGRYFDGYAPTCAVAENFTAVQGGPADPLVRAASEFADSGTCPAIDDGRARPWARRPAGADASPMTAVGSRAGGGTAVEPGERNGMLGR